jgi:hypothetical protein
MLPEATEAAAPASEITSNSGDLASLFLSELQAESAPSEEPNPKEPEAAVEAPEESAPAEAQTETEAEEAEEPAPAEPEDAAETPSEDPAIAAPSGMSEEDRKAFQALTPEMKAWVSKQASAANADYTKKSQAIAEHKKALDQGTTVLVEKLKALDGYLAKFTDNDIAPPDPALRQTDPMAYDDQLAQYMHAQHQKDLAGKERARVQAEMEQATQQQRRAFVQEQTEILRQVAPELLDGESGNQKRKQILEYGMKLGYSAEQLHGASANDIVTLWKAQKYDAIEAAKKQVKTVPPPAPKTVKPGPAKAVGRPSQVSAAIKTLDQAPTRDNLAAAYLAEIRSEKR